MSFFLNKSTTVTPYFFSFFVLLALGLALPSPAVAGVRNQTAFNETQNYGAESVPANAGDVIAYTLSYTSDTAISETISIEQDLTDILFAADVIDAGEGSLQANILRFPAVSVPASARVSRIFKIRIKTLPANTLDTLLSNTFGNGLNVHVRVARTAGQGAVKGAFIAPRAGINGELAVVFASFAVLGYYWFSRRQLIVRHF